MLTVTREEARRFVLCRQGLLGKHRFAGKEGAYRYVRQAGCIQYDPVDVCGKNAELTLQSRVRGVARQTLAGLLYEDRRLVDYADKEMSIWPSEDWPYFAAFRERSRILGESFPGMAGLKARAVDWIRANGPAGSDTLPVEGRLFWHSSMHWSGDWHSESQAARAVLEQLYTEGVLVIHHRSGSRKVYDLAERCLSPALLTAENPCPDEDSFLRWRVLRRIGAVGRMWDRRSDAWLGIAMTPAQRTAAFEALESEGAIARAEVEGIRGPLYFPAADLPLMEAVRGGTADVRPRLEFLAPLDPMLWDRRLIEALWDFRYSWEIYTPPAKRRYGYYVLPILFGERFAGRIEAAADRKAGTLTVRHVWYEDGVRRTKRLANALDDAAARLAAFNGCERVARED